MIFCFKLQVFLGEDKLFEYLITYLNSIGLPCGSAGKESVCNAGDQGLIPRLGRSPGESNSPFQCSGLENSLDCIVHGVAKSWTRLSNFHFIIIIIVFGDVSVCFFFFFPFIFISWRLITLQYCSGFCHTLT